MTTRAKLANPLKLLREQGQSVWLDYIRRDLTTSGELERLIEQDGLSGITSNPAIFEKAIGGSDLYAADLAELGAAKHLDAESVFERLAIEDIQRAATLLGGVHEATGGRDGFVSMEVSPRLAHDTQATIDAARRLWKAIDRPNLMIKVPATPAGLPAVEQLIGDGIHINVTLLFAVDTYAQVVDAYMAGLEHLAAQGGDVGRIASVASFFVSRMDSAIDRLIAERLPSADAGTRRGLEALAGTVAVANAKLAFERSQELYASERWQRLAARGAHPQRLLWASTSTKNPAFPDTLYVDTLIGPDTVNTMPPSTVEAFRDHGTVRPTLAENLEGAHATIDSLERFDISLDAVTDGLLDEGVRLFAEAFDALLGAVATACGAASRELMKRQTYRLTGELDRRVDNALATWDRERGAERLWAGDTSLWTGGDEDAWLGWLDIAAEQLAGIDTLRGLAEEVQQVGFRHVLLLGMGGSSLCPEVLAVTFGRREGFPELHILDSTDPAQVHAVEHRLDLARTLFIVASKSGSTLEPDIMRRHFWQRVEEVVGAGKAGQQFIAITDPGSALEQLAERDRYRRILHGVPSIGGRFSALSHFGMVPAAVMGLDCKDFLERAERMARACGAAVPTRDNPGVVLGVLLGELGRGDRDGRRDKVTLVVSPAIADLGAWLEQLIAESTGKHGQALIPVDGESPAAPERYGDDRIFVYLRLQTAADERQDAAVDALARAGHPVVKIAIADAADLGQEFYRWEIATAVAGAVMQLNPFDQPDVEASKVASRALTSAYEESGRLPAETPLVVEDGLAIFADPANARALGAAGGTTPAVGDLLRAHLARLEAGDYLALLAYVEMKEAHRRPLQAMRHAVRDARRVATCLGFGPRFLHSTGQAYKGGPASGVFLQITCDDGYDLPVPGRKYSFGVVKAAQARGDLEVLAERGRRALRVHLGTDVTAGLERLEALVREALA